MTNGNQSATGFLVGYAAGHDWPELWPKVAGARAAFVAELVGVSEEQAGWRPPGGDGEAAWSILEVTRHVLTYTPNVADIVVATAKGSTVTKDPPGALRPQQSETLANLLEELVVVSSRLVSLTRELPPVSNLETTVGHARFGQLNCRSWFLFASLHDADHTQHVQTLKQMPCFPA